MHLIPLGTSGPMAYARARGAIPYQSKRNMNIGIISNTLQGSELDLAKGTIVDDKPSSIPFPQPKNKNHGSRQHRKK